MYVRVVLFNIWFINTFFSYLERYSRHIQKVTLENESSTSAVHAVQGIVSESEREVGNENGGDKIKRKK